MAISEGTAQDAAMTPAQRRLLAAWDEHVRCEFASRDVDGTMATMVADSHVNHVPVMTGGVGFLAIREFYARSFIPQMPPDTETVLVSRTIGDSQIVDEMIFKFTHTIPMDWMLPGIPASGRRVEVPLVVIIGFRDGKVSHEHIYWDQASVLVQIGLLDERCLPVAGAETAWKVADPRRPSNELIDRARRQLSTR
jgi:carboxymethylenebutenolidase